MLRTRVRVASARATLILAALASTLVLLVGTAPVAKAGGPVYYLPIGCWSGTATTATGVVESVNSIFSPNGTFRVETPSGTFTGTWQSTGPRTFTYHFVRTLPGPGGTVIGSLDISHSATFTAWNKYTSTGTAIGTDLNGNVLFTGPVSSTGTRTF